MAAFVHYSIIFFVFCTASLCFAAEQPVIDAPDNNTGTQASGATEFYDPFASKDNGAQSISAHMADPISAYNRFMFTVNDKLYFYLLKPIARGYTFALPEPARTSIKKAFSNIGMPIRFCNCILQNKWNRAGTEISRFVINSTIGVAGLFDPAKQMFDLSEQDEDMGQTLGVYGLGHGFYLVLPFLGPSSARDACGRIFDFAANPLSYIPYSVYVKLYKTVNNTSLRLGDYEELKEASLDPYTSFKMGYYQHRQYKTQN